MPSDQLLVFFDAYPTLDGPALAKFIQDADPRETEVPEVQMLDEQVRQPDDETRELGLGSQPLRVSALLMTLGEFGLSVLVHNLPAPDQTCITRSRLREDLQEKLKQHKAFALLTLTGGENYAPPERAVLLYKVAFGLCQQGGTGVGHPEGMTAMDCETLGRLVQAMENEKATLWESLRAASFPSDLYSNTLAIEDEQRLWLVTFGNALLRLPDLAIAVDKDGDLTRAATALDEVGAFLREKGPVLQAGQKISLKQGPFVVAEPPASQEFLNREFGLWVLEAEG